MADADEANGLAVPASLEGSGGCVVDREVPDMGVPAVELHRSSGAEAPDSGEDGGEFGEVPTDGGVAYDDENIDVWIGDCSLEPGH